MPKFSNESLTRWKREIDAGPIVSSRMKLTRENSEYVGLCPFHGEKTPSFKLYKQDDGVWTYKCFGCGANGNVFQFIEKFDKVSFTKAVKTVLDIAGVAEDGAVPENSMAADAPAEKKELKTFPVAQYYPTEAALAASEDGRKWLAARGISYETAHKLRLGFIQSCESISPTHAWRDGGWILFPTFSSDRQSVIAVKYRSLIGKKEVVNDKMVSGILRAPNTATVLYNLGSVNPLEDVFVVEGEPDVAVITQLGIPCVGYPSGEYKPTDEECEVLKTARRRYLAGDNDKVGAAAMEALGQRIPSGSYIIHWPKNCKDANDVLMHECGGDTEKFAALVEILKAEALPLTPESIVRKASEVAPKRIKWMWQDRIPLGKITLFAGNPDNGKSVATADIAARVSRGHIFPGCTKGQPPADILMLIGEDDIDDTVVPRLMAAGADRSRIEFLEGVRQTNGGEVDIRLDEHIQALDRQLASNPNIRLVVIDPISNYLGKANMIAEQETRAAVLIPLKRLAAKYNIAIIMVMHLNKKNELEAISRIGGAMAFIGVSRCAWLFVRDKAEEGEDGVEAKTPDTFAMLRVKNNIARADKNGLAYTIKYNERVSTEDGGIGAPYVVWGEAVSKSADDALGAGAGNRKTKAGRPEGHGDKFEKATAWLQRALQGGPREVKELTREAVQGEGISEKMLRTAKEYLKVKYEATGVGRSKIYVWSLPEMNGTLDGVEEGEFEPHATPLDIG